MYLPVIQESKSIGARLLQITVYILEQLTFSIIIFVCRTSILKSVCKVIGEMFCCYLNKYNEDF